MACRDARYAYVLLKEGGLLYLLRHKIKQAILNKIVEFVYLLHFIKHLLRYIILVRLLSNHTTMTYGKYLLTIVNKIISSKILFSLR